MADQVENKIVNVIFNNKDFSKNIDTTIKDLQKFEKEIDDISKHTIKISYDSISSRHNIQKALFDMSSLNNKEITISVKLSNDIKDISNELKYLNKLDIKDIEIHTDLNFDIDEINKKLEEIVKSIKTPDIGLDLSLSSFANDIKSGIAYKFGDEIGSSILSAGKSAFDKIDLSGLKNNLFNAILSLKNLIPKNLSTSVSTNMAGTIGAATISKNIGSSGTIGGINLDGIKNTFANLGNNIVNVLSNAFGKVKEVAKNIDFQGFIDKTVGVFNTIYLAGGRFKNMFLNLYDKIKNNPFFNELINKFKGVFENLKGLASKALNKLQDIFSKIDFKGMSSKFKDTLNKFKNYISPVTKAIKDGFSKIDFKGMANKFKDDLKGMYDKHFSPFIDKIKDKIGKINMNDVADKVANGISTIAKKPGLLGAGLIGGVALFGKNIPFVGDLLGKLTGGSNQFNESLNNINNSVDTISSKFTVMGRVWFDTLTRMAQNAVDAGIRMVKSLSIDNITSGYSAMEAKNNSIRTIMNSTTNNKDETDEAKLERITENVEKLVTFTDETSYNFQDMMNGLSSFTSAGVGLEQSVSYMMGIANWAAYAGKNAKEAGTAFDVMSKVIANGSMDLMRFRQLSTQGFISNATRKQWLEMAAKVGTLKKEINSAGDAVYRLADGTEVTAQNMETTLTKGKWLSSDVITKSLGEYSKFSDTVMAYYNNINNFQEELSDMGKEVSELSDEELDKLSKKYNLATSDLKKFADEEVTVSKLIEILGNATDEHGVKVFDRFSVEAFKSAQEARTFGDAIESVKVAVSAGWSKSFETIFGNVEEQSKLWTGLANKLYDVFMAGTDTRNEFLKFAKNLGAFDNIIMGVSNLFNSLLRILGTVSEAFKSIFFPDLDDKAKGVRGYAESFTALTNKFAKWTASIAPTPEMLEDITNALRGLFSIAKTVIKVIMAIPWGPIFSILSKVAGAIGSIITSLSNGLLNSGLLDKVGNSVNNLGSAINKISSKDVIGSLAKVIGLILALKAAFAALSIARGISKITDAVNNSFNNLQASYMDKLAMSMLKMAAAIGILSLSMLILSKIDFLKSLKGLVIMAGEMLVLIGAIKLLDKIGINSLKINVIAIALVAFAGAILLLTASVAILGNLKLPTLVQGLIAVGLLLAGFTIAFKVISNSLKGFKSLNLIPVAAAMIAFAGAMVVLAGAVAILGFIPLPNLIQGFIALEAILWSFVGAFTVLSKSLKGLGSLNLIPTAVAIIAFAGAMIVLGGAVAIFAALSKDLPALAIGFVAMEAVLWSFVGAFTVLSNVLKNLGSLNLIPTSIAIIAFSGAMVVLGGAVAIFATLAKNDLPALLIGFAVLEGLLWSFVVAFIALSKVFSGISSLELIPIAIALGVFAGSMMILAGAVAILANVPMENMQPALEALGTTLLGIIGLAYILQQIHIEMAAVQILALAGALLLCSIALKVLDGLNYDNVALGIIAIVSAFTAFLAIGAIMITVAPALGTALLPLAAVIAAIGVAAAGMGAGIYLGALGIKTLQDIDYQKIIDGFALIAANADKLVVAGAALAAVGFGSIIAGIGSAFQGVGDTLKGVGNTVLAFSDTLKGLGEAGVTAAKGIAEGVASAAKGIGEGIGNFFAGGSEEEKLEKKALALTKVAEAMEKLKNVGEVTVSTQGLQGAIDNVILEINNSIQNIEQYGRTSALNYINGLNAGLTDQELISQITASSSNLANAIKNAFDTTLKISSPSKVGKDSGGYYVIGVGEGINKKTYITEEAAKELGISVADATEEELSPERSKEISEKWTDSMKTNLEKKEDNYKKIGRDSGGYYVEGTIDGVEGKKYLTEEAAKELGFDMEEETVKPFDDKEKQKILADHIGDYIKKAADQVDVTNLGEVAGQVMDNINGGSKTIPSKTGPTEEDLKKRKKAQESFQKEYKKELKSEVEWVKYYAEEEKKIYEKKRKYNVEGFTQTLIDQTDFNANAQTKTNEWLDNLANSYEQADASFNDYLSSLDENASEEEKIQARRLSALRKFNEEWAVKSGFSFDMSGKEAFKQEKSELKSKDIIKNQNSQLQGYKNFIAEIEKLAGTNVSDEFLRAVWQGGPNSDIYKNAMALSGDELEKFAANYDFIYDAQQKDSKILDKIIANRKAYKEAKLAGVEYHPEADKITVTQPEVEIKTTKQGLKQGFKDAGAEDDELDNYLGEYNAKVNELKEKGYAIAEARKEAYQEIISKIKEANADDSGESETSEDDQLEDNTEKLFSSATIGPKDTKKAEQQAYDAGKAQMDAAADGLNQAASEMGTSLGQGIDQVSTFTNAGYENVAQYVTGIQNGITTLFPALREQLTAAIATLPIVQGMTNTQPTTEGEQAQTDQDTSIEGQVAEMEGRLETVEQAIQQIMDKIYAMLEDMTQNGVSGVFAQQGVFIDKGIAIGIKKNIGEVRESVANMCQAAIQEAKMQLGIASPSQEFYDIGTYIIEGLCNAITDGQSAVTEAMVSEVLAKMDEAAEDEEGINSPSKKWYKFGSFIDQGLANGISENVQTPMNALSELISGISEDMEYDDEYNPVITPVIDLSEAQKQSKQISTLFANEQAMDISANLASSRLHQNKGQNSQNTQANKTINFTQNNYSPKALSREEIYRQTRNQFSQIAND